MILHRHLLKESLPIFLLTLGFLTLVYLFGFFYAGARWLEGVPLGKVLYWLAHHIPGILVQAMPIALVITAVLVYGRLAQEGGVFALLGGGVPLWEAAKPLLVLGLVLAGIGLYLQEDLVPWANARVRQIWWDEIHTQGAGLFRLKGLQIPIGKGRSLYFEDYDMEGKKMLGVRIASFDRGVGTFIFAERGDWQGNRLTLEDYRVYRVDFDRIDQLEEDLAAIRKVFPAVSRGKVLEVESDLSRAKAIAEYADTFSFGQNSLSEAYRKIKDPFAAPLEVWKARLEFHSKLALPFSSLVLVLLALPMAMRHGKSTGLALGLSLLLALGYYGLFFLGRSLAGIGLLPPEVGAWGANAFFLVLGYRALSG
ncbi:MAG: LptF/LptG family permease [Thermaceae bacterium]